MSDFNNDPFGPPPGDSATAAETPAVPAEAPATEAALSPAFARFRSCRWQQPKEDGTHYTVEGGFTASVDNAMVILDEGK